MDSNPKQSETRGDRDSKPRGRWFVRSWFGIVFLVVFLEAALLIYDWMYGEAVAHLGWRFMITISTIPVLAVAVLCLPLLVVGVIRDRKPT